MYRTLMLPTAGLLASAILASCSMGRQLQRVADETLLSDSALQHAHVGVSVYDPQLRRQLYAHHSDRYFVPASNTKIITCFAAMKHLGDSLEAMRWIDLDTAILLLPSGDPTLLHPDFHYQPVIDFLASASKPLYVDVSAWRTMPLGSGWSWDDYDSYYMAERSPFPVHGNYITWQQSASRKEHPTHPGDTVDVFITSDPEGPWQVDFHAPDTNRRFSVGRDRDKNHFLITEGKPGSIDVPFVTEGAATAIAILQERMGGQARLLAWPEGKSKPKTAARVMYSVPTDSMLKPLMHRSDNFFAEQALLMVSHRLNGSFLESAAIDTLMAHSLSGMPHAPRWADGSGLSRYNLFTPDDFVWVLDRMRSDFGIDRVRAILPTAGTGTLGSMDRRLQGRVYAKTGTLSGVVALSGFLQTRKGRWLAFSLLVNNHRTAAAWVRKRFEAFLLALYEQA